MKIRTGGPDDTTDILRLLDDAVSWPASLGRTGQWGEQPWSTRPAAVERVHAYTNDPDTFLTRIAEDTDHTTVGSCVLSEQAPEYVTPTDRRELYIRNLVTSRARSGTGIGAALVADALQETRRRGLTLLRVDCYAGDDRQLVTQYQRLGFTPTEAFEVPLSTGPWPGQVLAIEL